MITNPFTGEQLTENFWGAVKHLASNPLISPAGAYLTKKRERKRKIWSGAGKPYRPSKADQQKYGLDKYGDLVDAKTRHERRKAGFEYP